MRGDRPPLSFALRHSPRCGLDLGPSFGRTSSPRGPGAGQAEGGEAAGLTRGAEAEAGGDGRVFCELQSDDNQ